MGAVRKRVQTADKNITMLHKESTWLQSILWREYLHVCKEKKSIIKAS